MRKPESPILKAKTASNIMVTTQCHLHPLKYSFWEGEFAWDAWNLIQGLRYS